MSSDQGSSDSSMGSRKVLRRKPPPPLDEDPPSSPASQFSYSVTPVPSPSEPVYAMPVVPPRPKKKKSLKVNTIPEPEEMPVQKVLEDTQPRAQDIYEFSTPPKQSRPPQEYSPTRVQEDIYDLSFNDDFNEDSILSYDSPKPMGPKELPDYDSPSYLPSPKPYTTRQFQQLSRSKSQPAIPQGLPYPADNGYEANFSDEESEYVPPEFTSHRPNLESSPTQARTAQIIDDSLASSSRIPRLNTDNSFLPPPLKSRTSMPLIRNHVLDHDQLYSPVSPPDLHHSQSVGNRSTSPVRSQTLSIPGRSSPTNHYMDSVHAERQNRSKSSSPSKYGRSPSLMYGQNSFPSSEYMTAREADESDDYEQEIVNDYQYDYENEQRASKWNSVEPQNAKRYSHGEYNFLDDDYLETPTANYFDYSILPDLPSVPSSAVESPLSLKKGTSLSSMSMRPFRDSAYSQVTTPSSAILPVLPTKKKDEALPPVPLDLPQLPFASASLVTQHFAACKHVWSLSHIFQWCQKLRIWLHDSFIPRREFKKALIKLLVFHRRELPLDLIARNVDQILETLLAVGAIEYFNPLQEVQETSDVESLPPKPVKQEHVDPGVTIKQLVQVSGVLTELTVCYYRGNNHGSRDINLRCYSSQCYLNKRIDYEKQLKNMKISEIILGHDWASHWKLSAVDLKQIDKGISKKQSLIFDLLRYEQTFIQRASCFVDYVGPEFIKAARGFMGSDIVSLNKFEDDIIKPGRDLVKLHRSLLLEPLLQILIAGGKFIQDVTGISDIYYTWSQEVKNSLLRYMSTVPMIEDLLDNENLKKWVDVHVSNIPKVKELNVNGSLLFLSTFNSRYQSLPLQLLDVKKMFDEEDPEFGALAKSIEGIKKLGAKVNDMKRHADNIHALKKVHKQLVWKNIRQPAINLGSENRRFFFRGDVTRKGDLKINSYTNHLILLDHYLFITEKIKNPRSSSYSLNKVTENPVPVELLLVEEKEASTPLELKPISLSLGSQAAPATQSPVTPGDTEEDEPTSFPFKVRCAGRGKHDSFTFSTKTEKERAEWIGYFIQARSNICLRLKKTEPYNVGLISNTCFAYEQNNRIQKLQVCAKNDPIYELSHDALVKLRGLGYSNDLYNFQNSRDHLVFSKVLSVCSFEFRLSTFHLVGLSSGLYCSDTKNRWKKVVHDTDITKIHVETSINLLIILGNKHLKYYPLDSILGVYYEKKRDITGVSLSNDPVSFFSVGRHREITMLFYAKKKTNSGSTNFKVMIPETDNDGVFSAFKVASRFYIQAECFGISIFNTSFAVHTIKGYEILELDKLNHPRSIPEFPHNETSRRIDGYSRRSVSSASGVDAIRRYVSPSVRPMGMFKLANNAEFLCVYNDCAIFTNKHGKLSRTSFIRFEFKAKSIAFRDNHLFIVCDEVIEVWSISDYVNGSNKLIQVVTGKDISAVNTDTLCFTVANPLVQGLQLVFQLAPNANTSTPAFVPLT